MSRSYPTLALLALAAVAAGRVGVAAQAAEPGQPFPHAQLAKLAAHVAHRDGLNRRAVLRVLRHARAQPAIIDKISRPAEQVLEWWQYRQIFLTDKRISAGVEFWREHRDSLERVSAEEGVPPQYIVAILGAETYYGHITGSYRVLDALATLAFDYPPRARYFRGELENFLLLTHREKIDPLSVKGSYAGAMGPLQFMPSAYLRYGVDGNDDGQRDLFDDWDDVFASVAHYLQQCGWQPGGPVVADVRIDPGAAFHIDPANLRLDETIDGLNAQGVRVQSDVPGNTPVVLLLAEQQDGPTYRVGFSNFHALTRYNHSALYAMAVDELARAIALRLTPSSPDTAPAATPAAKSAGMDRRGRSAK
ncbi:MAG TPA: lytic murein transglycosylase B [Steroidobacteraceae bacterium]|jgi:membrane-bound lytic murein transglycosylase B|nr:lytic murein transglycosylase B [Steroidobacteraceae bacterium]